MLITFFLGSSDGQTVKLQIFLIRKPADLGIYTFCYEAVCYLLSLYKFCHSWFGSLPIRIRGPHPQINFGLEQPVICLVYYDNYTVIQPIMSLAGGFSSYLSIYVQPNNISLFIHYRDIY